MSPQSNPNPSGDVVHPSALPFLLVHLGCVAAVWSGVTWSAVVLGIALYWLRMFAITAGYHRYFSHRAFSTGRAFQFVLAFLAQSSAQKSVLWWAAKHRHHHLWSDTSEDPHSPGERGFFHSHIGWIFDRGNVPTDLVKVADLARFPELRWLHRWHALPAVVLAGLCFLVAGWPGLIVGFCWSTVLVYHATFSINSLAHVHGARRYVTGDDSRNNLTLALITMGEGWHNNHHAFQSSARQGFRWWQVDATFYILKSLEALGLVHGLKTPPEAVLRNVHPIGARVLQRTAERLAARLRPDEVAREIRRSVDAMKLRGLVSELDRGRRPSSEALENLHLPLVPRRSDFIREAHSISAVTHALDELVERARDMFWVAVGQHLATADAQPT